MRALDLVASGRLRMVGAAREALGRLVGDAGAVAEGRREQLEAYLRPRRTPGRALLEREIAEARRRRLA